MNMQDYTTPFAINGDRDEFSIDTDPSGNVSLERGWTEPYQLRPEEGGKFIPRRIFNQMMNLVSTDTVTWKTQTFPNWIADKGDGAPYAYPKDMIVKYTDGNIYLSKVDNNIAIPTDTTSWSLYSFDINSLTSKTTPVDTDNLKIQETSGLFKKVNFDNLIKTKFIGANQSLSNNGYQKLPGGLIVQWGSIPAGTPDGMSVYFPISFPNALFTVVATPSASLGPDHSVSLYFDQVASTLSYVRIPRRYVNSGGNVGVATQGAKYIAIGY